jgi:hypothetical protein
MADDVVYKTPSEKIRYDYDFAPLLPSTDASATLAVSAIDEEGTSATATVIGTTSISGTAGLADLQAGTDGKDYTCTMRATGATSGAIRDWVVEMRVRTKVGGQV